MDKEALVKALRTGVEEFDRLRKQAPADPLDLSGADLSGCNLRKADLGRAKLQGANLRDADLTGANLGNADLRQADLTGARLADVSLHRTQLAGARLDEALLGGFGRDGRICIHSEMFNNVRWGREHLESFLKVLNENPDWEIRYQIVPKAIRVDP